MKQIMNRIEVLRDHIDEVLSRVTDVKNRRHAVSHLYGVAQACALIALKRGQNEELAVMAGMLHDVYSYVKKDINDHAHKGAILAKEILTSLRVTNDDETELICHAIYNHSEKEVVHSDFDEVLKDADIFQSCLYNPTIEILPGKKKRYETLKREFGIS